MNLELHILQSFAPSNLNRDDTGSPKDCEFGGVRRARISSQCWKRAIRLAFSRQGLLKEDSLALRTRKIAAHVAQLLVAAGKDAEEAKAVADHALAAIGLGAGKSGNSEYLLFVPRTALDQFAATCLTNWDALKPEAGKKASKKGSEVPKEVSSALEQLFLSGKTADLALFGRMIADRPNDNVVAAAQVAHALSTHKVDLEFDFYTAVDDLQEGETGAGMMGTIEYNAACFYRYANLDLGQLQKNLEGDTALVMDAVEAFLRASVEAVPTGKQNSMAAQNPPSFVSVVLRDHGFWSLANAFLKPVRASGTDDLATGSIKALGEYWAKLWDMYGKPEGVWLGISTLHKESLNGLAGQATVDSVPKVFAEALALCAKALQA